MRNIVFDEITALLSLHTFFDRERRMTNIRDTTWMLSVEETYSQLIEHISDRLTNPMEAINKATHILAKYYLDLEEQMHPSVGNPCT